MQPSKPYAHTISWRTLPDRKRALKVLAAELDVTEGELVDQAIEAKFGKQISEIVKRKESIKR
jgi:hypothetical protein